MYCIIHLYHIYFLFNITLIYILKTWVLNWAGRIYPAPHRSGHRPAQVDLGWAQAFRYPSRPIASPKYKEE